MNLTNRIDAAHDLHSRTFDLVKTQVVGALLQWEESSASDEPDLSRFPDCVYIKDASGHVIRENRAFRDAFAQGETMIGQPVSSDPTFTHLDAVLMRGHPWIECQHFFSQPRGKSVLQTYQRRLDEIEDPAFCILGVTRILGYLERDEEVRQLSLREQFAVFNGFDETDHTICHMIAEGESTKDIAATVGLTTKSIENRRQRMMIALGLQRPVEIVKLMVRLEENRLMSRRH